MSNARVRGGPRQEASLRRRTRKDGNRKSFWTWSETSFPGSRGSYLSRSPQQTQSQAKNKLSQRKPDSRPDLGLSAVLAEVEASIAKTPSQRHLPFLSLVLWLRGVSERNEGGDWMRVGESAAIPHKNAETEHTILYHNDHARVGAEGARGEARVAGRDVG